MMADTHKLSLLNDGTTLRPLRPLIRAYALGYVTTIGPRLFGFLRVLSRRDISISTKIYLLYTILKTAAEPNRLPTACAIIVGGATALPRLIRTILQGLLLRISPRRLSLLGPRFMNRLRFVTSFLSAYLAFNQLNKDPAWSRKRALSMNQHQYPNQNHIPTSPPEFAGKTIDFTLFAFTRALDALVITLWTRSKSSWARHPSKTHPTTTTRFLTQLADPTIFSLSAATIMWAWFYAPERLPKSYQTWISSAAQIDPRLVEALRRARRGQFRYGVDTGQAPLLTPLCRELDLPRHWADPKITVPIPCELYHCGAGPSCEIHALRRFQRSFVHAMTLYLPLNLVSRAATTINISSSSFSSSAVLRNIISIFTSVLKSSARSSSFLAAFVSTFYYTVCLARTRLGPRLIPLTTVTRQMWDSGLCVLAACLACGWSILLETPTKRQELAAFVAPRALATLLPRVYERRYIRRERWAFAGSVAVVLALLDGGGDREGNAKKQRVRGVLGRILERVLRE